MEQTPARRPGERVFGIILLLVSGFLVWQSYAISGFAGLSSPGAFPLAASSIMLVAAAILVVRDFLRAPVRADLIARARSFSAEITPASIVVFTGFVMAYGAMLEGVGFLPSSLAFLLIAIQFLHRGRLRFSLAMALGALVSTYTVFRLVFKVVLPEGIVPEREILAWLERLFTGGGS